MTKRFVAYFDKDHHYIIQDLVNEDEYQVGFVNCDEDLFLELVNALAETSCDCITDCEIVIKKLKEENEQLKSFKDTTFVLINEMIETANHYRTPIKSLRYGDDLGYWNGVYQKLKELRDILKGDDVE